MSIGPAGERGKTGDHGQRGDIGDTGDTGARGATGRQGPAGIRGRALTLTQSLGMFILILVIGLSLAFALEWQQQRLRAQQADLARKQALIEENADRIAENRYQSCLNGARIIGRFNDQQRTLADIERRNVRDPLSKLRVKAYEDAVMPIRACQR